MCLYRLIIIIVLGTISFSSIGQTSKRYEKYSSNLKYTNGQVTTRSGEIIEGLVKRYDDLRAYKQVVIVTKQGEKKRYYPSSLEEYTINQQRFISNLYFFFKIISEGNGVSLYERQTSSPTAYGTMLHTEFFYRRTSDTDLLRVRKLSFKNTFVEFFSDCPKLQAKIDNKEFKYSNLEQMFLYYQHTCNKQQKVNDTF